MNDKMIQPSHQTTISDIVCEEPIQTIVVDGFQGLIFTNGSLRLNLIEDKMDAKEQNVKRHVVLRLAMPLQVADSFADVLKATIQQLNSDILENGKPKTSAPDGK